MSDNNGTVIMDENVQNDVQAPKKTATCNVSYGRDGINDWISIQSMETRSVLSINISSLQRSWATFTDQERAVLSTLMQGDTTKRNVQVPYSMMKVFKQAVERAVKSASMDRYTLFIYDIPEVPQVNPVNGQTRNVPAFPNPSHRIRRWGYRLNLSCWTIPLRLLSQLDELRNEMTQAGCNVHNLDFAEYEYEKMKELARKQLTAETGRIQQSMLDSIDSASEQLRVVLSRQGTTDEATGKEYPVLTAKEQRKAQLYRNNRIKASIKAAQEGLRDAISCATHFDETEHLDSVFMGLAKSIESRVELLSQMQAETIRA